MQNFNEVKKEVKDYQTQILDGRILAGELIKLALRRHINDLENSDHSKYYFDEQAAYRVIKFIQKLKFIKGDVAGDYFILSPWQKWLVWVLYGWKKRDNQKRRFRYAYIEVARKNGKSTLLAALCLYHLVADKEQGTEIYTAATKTDQARIVWEAAKHMSLRSPGLSQVTKGYKNHVEGPFNGVMKALSSKAHNLDGLNPGFCVIDEYHEHKDDRLYNVLKSAAGQRSQPLQFTITTAGFDLTKPCFHLRETCRKILEEKFNDDQFFTMIFTIDDEDDWEDKSVWIKSNPQMPYSSTMSDYLKGEYVQARNLPSQRVNFKTKNLNVWTASSADFIEDLIWQQNEEEIEDSILREVKPIGGMDLSETKDITAFALIWKLEDHIIATLDDFDNYRAKYYVKVWCWLPESQLHDNVNSHAYTRWENEGWLKATPGNVVDYRIIKNDIIDICSKYGIERIGFDPWNCTQIATQLYENHDIVVEEVRQNAANLHEPCKYLETLAYNKSLKHDGNPILRWCLGNIEMKLDDNNNMRPSKRLSRENKIDAAAAMITGLASLMSAYEVDAYEYYQPDMISLDEEKE